jgi:hypothetical protein
MFVTLRGEPYLLWRAVDEHGAELDILLQKRRDKAAAKRLLQACAALESGAAQARHRSAAQLSGSKSRDHIEFRSARPKRDESTRSHGLPGTTRSMTVTLSLPRSLTRGSPPFSAA